MTVQTLLLPDRSENKLLTVRVQDVEPILDRNKRLQTSAQNKKANWRHIACIPNVILEQWLSEEWRHGNLNLKLFSPEFDALIARKLNDPDWKWLRTDK
jgi:hypothetical protein